MGLKSREDVFALIGLVLVMVGIWQLSLPSGLAFLPPWISVFVLLVGGSLFGYGFGVRGTKYQSEAVKLEKLLEFFQDGDGKLSNQRLNSTAAAFVAFFLCIYAAVVDWNSVDYSFIITLLAYSVGGKVFSKGIEVYGRNGKGELKK